MSLAKGYSVQMVVVGKKSTHLSVGIHRGGLDADYVLVYQVGDLMRIKCWYTR